MNVVFRPEIDTPFSPTVANVLEKVGGSFENLIVLDDEDDKENSPPTIPLSERPIEPPRMLSRPFGLKMCLHLYIGLR